MTDDKAAAPQQQLCLSPGTRQASVALGHVDKLGIEATINQSYAAVAIDGKKAMKDFVKLALKANHLEMHELASTLLARIAALYPDKTKQKSAMKERR